MLPQRFRAGVVLVTRHVVLDGPVAGPFDGRLQEVLPDRAALQVVFAD